MSSPTPLEQATAELKRQFANKRDADNQLHHYSLQQIINYLQSCGIELEQYDHYQLVQELRQAGYKETLQDQQLVFHFYQ
jgi:hypothetical protein